MTPRGTMKNVYQFLGVQIKRARKKLSLTQEALSFKADISQNFVGQIERGMKKASLVTIDKIAGALGLSLGELLKDEAAEPQKYDSQDEKVLYYLRERSPKEKDAVADFLKTFPLQQGRGKSHGTGG